MKDKNGKIITVGLKCIVDDKFLGVITALFKKTVSVLMLTENTMHCHEEEVDPSRIEIKD